MPSDTPNGPALPGAPFVAYKSGQLHLEDAELDVLAHKYGTPLYAYSRNALLDALAAYQRALKGCNALICYAVKANPSLAILKLFNDAGCGFDIVSQGELERVLTIGGAPERIVFSGVGKTRQEIARALEVGIRCFNVESLPELDVLSEVAHARHQTAHISLRVNPNVDAHTHPYIATGLKGNKFGISHERALDAYRRAADLPGLQIDGIDCHIGSQITSGAPYLEALDRVLDLVAMVEATGIHLNHFDLGGGMGIRYEDETPESAESLYGTLLQRLQERGYGDRSIIVEPGRSLVGNAGVLLTRVLYTKPTEQKNFCIVDAAMNDLARPALYQAYHAIVPTTLAAPHRTGEEIWDIVGPVCESGDWLGRDRSLNVSAGDTLAILSAGAYGMSMASNYNTRPRAAEVLVSGTSTRVIRNRESLADLWRHEVP